MLTVLTFVSGCGGGNDKPAVDTLAVENSVSKILDICLKKSYDPTVEDSQVSTHTNRLIQALNDDPDAKLPESSALKVKTVRGAAEAAAQFLDDCKPEDAARLNDALSE